MIVGLGHALLRLAHRQVVIHAVFVAILRFFQSFVGQVHAGASHLHQLLRRSNVQQRIANVCVHLRVLVAELSLIRVQCGLCDLGLPAQGKLRKQRRAESAGRVSGAVRAA